MTRHNVKEFLNLVVKDEKRFPSENIRNFAMLLAGRINTDAELNDEQFVFLAENLDILTNETKSGWNFLALLTIATWINSCHADKK